MKKLLSFILTNVLAIFCVALFAQEVFVSTTPSKKNVVIEEYTGMNCPNCPDGHASAAAVMAADPTRVSVINIHTGDYAVGTPNYQTPFGYSLMVQTGLPGVPAGTINRHVFSGSVTYVRYDYWSSRANTIKNQDAYCNIAARATLDPNTRELAVHAQVYYTRSGAPSTMRLNIALIQDSILGPQSGMNNNPSQVIGSQYCHMHMLRHLLTGQWGYLVNNTSEGTLVDTVVTYTIPSDLNDVEYVLNHLKIVAFIAEGRQEIITGCHCDIDIINQRELSVIPTSISLTNTTQCGTKKAQIRITNPGMTTVTSASGTYEVNGVAYDLNYSGSLASYANASFTSDPIEIPAGVDIPLKVTINSCNGQTISETSITRNHLYYDAAGNITVKIKTDSYSAPYTNSQGGTNNGEQSWKLYNPAGQVIESKTNSDFRANVVNSFPITVSGEPGCYRFYIKDSYGDGIAGGYYKIIDSHNHEVVYGDGGFGSSANAYFYWDGVTAITDFEENNGVVIYPNPTTDKLHIASDNFVNQVQIFNMQGQLVKTEFATDEVSVNQLSTGMYIIKIYTNAGCTTMKFNKH